jgi:protoporphyrinogen oxidase
MTGKFGDLDDTIAASWLWARVHKRTPSLIYIEGGFQTIIDALASAINKNGGTIKLGVNIPSIEREERMLNSEYRNNNNVQFTIHNSPFDTILLTTPTPIANKLVPDIASRDALTIPHLSAQVLVLETEEPLLNKIYWLSVTDRSFPFLAVVAHTNFMDKKHYGGHHITYIGNYLPNDHAFLTLSKEQLLNNFLPYIKRLTQNSEFRILNSYLFNAPFAQPVHQINYSKKAPTLTTPFPNIYLANMDSIYPWDRGTNYAVELGQKAARLIQS